MNYNILSIIRLMGMRGMAFLMVFFTLGECWSQLPVYGWRSHLPMSRFDWIGELPGKIYAANKFGVIVYDEADASIEELTKINGLTQTNISCFTCSYDYKRCIVGYGNGNLDIIDDHKVVVNQPAIVSSNIVGDKAVFDSYFEDEGTVLLASGIGLLQMDLTTYDIREFEQIMVNGEAARLKDIEIINDTIYMLTDKGLLFETRNDIFLNPQPIVVPFVGSLDRLAFMFTVNDKLHVCYQHPNDQLDTIYALGNNGLYPIAGLAGKELRHIAQYEDALLVTHRDEITKYNLGYEEIERIFAYSNDPGVDANMAIYDHNGSSVLVADNLYGAIKTSFANQYSSLIISKSSPRNGMIGVLQEEQGVIYAMPGGEEFNFNPPFLSVFEDEKWTNNTYYHPETNEGRNTTAVAVTDQYTYVAFNGSGLAVLDADMQVIEYFNEDNAEIEGVFPGYYGIAGIELDDENNLWMANSRATSTLSILDQEGNWTLIFMPEFPKPFIESFMRHSSGIFVLSLKESGILLYNPSGTPTDISDDVYVSVNASPTSGNLPNNSVHCVVEDRDGELWIGTDEGIGVIYNVESMFGNNPEDVQRIIVNQDGYNGYLFESDAVTDIVVDGANRKWVAPSGAGLFLISADGQEQISAFTIDNSPLFNNNILSLAIQPEIGELFIATESGLQSLRTDATQPDDQMASLRVFPNPVKPGYSGVISISGLSENSYVRVTDASGVLVYEGASNGGTAIWDGKDAFGKRVSSGVYLIFAAARNGLGGAVTKLMVLN